jgi:hypothetical protein
MKYLLFPILLLCLSSSPSPAQTGSADLKLTGIINLPGYKCALLEDSKRITRLTLLEGQREGSVEVVQIDSENGTAKLNLKVGKTNAVVTLQLNSETNPPTTSRVNAHSAIQLHDANLEHVLQLYGQFSERSLLRPTLTTGPFTLQAPATNQAEAALALAEALAAKGLTNIPDGKKFIIVLPVEKASMAVPRSSQIQSPAGQAKFGLPSPADIIPTGQINFPDVNFASVFTFYVELAYQNRQRDRSASLPPSFENIHFRTQTSLTRAEVVYALDTLFSWQNIKIVPVGTNLVKAAQITPK